MIIVADSSALVALATCGSLWVLKELFNEVIAFPDLMTYSYIKKIEPENKFCTPIKKAAK